MYWFSIRTASPSTSVEKARSLSSSVWVGRSRPNQRVRQLVDDHVTNRRLGLDAPHRELLRLGVVVTDDARSLQLLLRLHQVGAPVE
jgi:hypothetical protein